jgi:adenylylsulfate kinase
MDLISKEFSSAGPGLGIADESGLRAATDWPAVTRSEREARGGHRGLVIWLTGLSGAGKTTIGSRLERVLFEEGRQTYFLDGDVVRRGLCQDLDYSDAGRHENIRRVGEVAALFADAGTLVIAAFVSPFRADREQVRRVVTPGRFLEIFVNAPLAVCESRDPKGLYARARAQGIANFTGISAPYEAPLQPDLEVRTDAVTPDEGVAQVLSLVNFKLSEGSA